MPVSDVMADGETRKRGEAPQWLEEPPELRKLAAPGQLTVPLSGRRDSGIRARPAGTVVARGEVLVHSSAESFPVPLAPAAGRLGGTVEVQLTDGQLVPAVELLVDEELGQATESGEKSQPGKQAEPDVSRAALVTWIGRLRGSGVWADRHASPDLIGQLHQIMTRPIELVVCGVLDTDPNVRLNAALGARHSEEIIAGTSFLSRLSGAERAIVAIDSEEPPTWSMPVRMAARQSNIDIVEMRNYYPQTDPTLMVFVLAQRRLKPGQLPTTQGVLLVDAAAALAVGRGKAGDTLLSTPVAVHDHIHRKAHFLSVPIGMQLKNVLQELRISPDWAVLRGGDLLRDLRLSADAVVGGSELVIHVTGPELMANPDPCIRCGWCMDTCPTRVQPATLLDAAQRQDAGMARRGGIHACIECGLCAHVCPSKLPLLGAIREMK